MAGLICVLCLRFAVIMLEMATKVTMPQMGYDMTEGTINRWYVKEGDSVSRGDNLASIATDKADIDIESYADGTVRRIVAQPGQTVPVGSVVAWIGDPNENIPEETADTPAAVVVASGPSATEAPAAQPAATPRVGDTTPQETKGRQKISPYARKRASELGIDISYVSGSGPEGRVIAADVEGVATQHHKSTVDTSLAAIATEALGEDSSTTEELSKLRRAVAKSMAEAKSTIPHFYLTVDIDVAALLATREECNALGADTPKFSVTDFIVRACASMLQTHPQLNASWSNGAVQRYQHSNIAIAVALTDGLVAPALRNCESMSMRQLAFALHNLVARAKSNRLRQEELSGAHMAVSNLGMFGIEEFSAIITPPQSSVVAVGAVREVPVVANGNVAIGQRMRMTMSIDHRITDGAQAAEALGRIKWLLEHPAALLV